VPKAGKMMGGKWDVLVGISGDIQLEMFFLVIFHGYERADLQICRQTTNMGIFCQQDHSRFSPTLVQVDKNA
jgi:hypothetical protein